MPTANARKGAETERMVAAYLRPNGFPLADRRLREGRQDDQGDIDGVPATVVQVKYVQKPALQSWITDTLKQRDTAGVPLCLLVVRIKGRPPQAWDAYMPSGIFVASYEHADGWPVKGQPDEREAWTWMRMDLRMAALVLRRIVPLYSRSALSSITTSRALTIPKTTEWPFAPSTERVTPPSPTT